jgi:hypothetical protein
MGKSKSSASQTITNNTVNQNFVNSVNKQIMESAVNTMVKNASSCSSAVNVNNSCDMSGTKVSGDFDFSGNQTAQVSVNFNCIQASQTSADMATAMASAMAAEMKALNGTDAAANLNTASQASSNTGALSMPTSSASSSKTNVTNNVTNETITNVENIFQQNLSNNFSAETVNECIGKTTVSNSQDLANMDVGGNAKVSCVQTASLEAVQNCKQLSEAISKTTQSTFQELGLTTSVTNETASTTESTVSSKSETVATGIFQDLGNLITGLFGMLGLAFLGPLISPICAICGIILCACSAFIAYRAISGSGGDSGSGSGAGFGSGSGSGSMTDTISDMSSSLPGAEAVTGALTKGGVNPSSFSGMTSMASKLFNKN